MSERIPRVLNDIRKKKTCSICKEEQAIEDFGVMKDKSNGVYYRRSYCKTCARVQRNFWGRKKRAHNNPEEHWDCPKCEFFWKRTFGQFCSMCGVKGIKFQEGSLCKI